MSIQLVETTVTSSRVVPRIEEPAAPLVRHAVYKFENTHMMQFFAIEDWKVAEAPEIIDVARVRKVEIVARCGHRWVPQMTNPSGLETCDACIDIMSKQEYDD